MVIHFMVVYTIPAWAPLILKHDVKRVIAHILVVLTQIMTVLVTLVTLSLRVLYITLVLSIKWSRFCAVCAFTARVSSSILKIVEYSKPFAFVIQKHDCVAFTTSVA